MSSAAGRPTALLASAADSATDAWAVGYYVSKSVRHTLILHWNGTAWSVR